MPDKTIIQKPVTKGHLGNITLLMVDTTKTWSAVYTPRDATGAEIGQPRSIQGTIGQDPSLFAWVDEFVLPVINQFEGTA